MPPDEVARYVLDWYSGMVAWANQALTAATVAGIVWVVVAASFVVIELTEGKRK